MTHTKETYWSQFADDYEKRQAFVAGDDLIRIMMERLRMETNLKYVLELGCGTGLFTEVLCQNALSVRATDFSDEMVASAIELRETLPNVLFSKEDATHLSFEDQSFDSVFMANLIHVIGEPDKAIAETIRVLKPGGRIIITSFAIDAMGFFNKIKMTFRYVKTFGKVPEEARKVKINPKVVEQLLIKNNLSLLNNELLGNATKSLFIVAEKKN